jgi:hypothetical protein
LKIPSRFSPFPRLLNKSLQNGRNGLKGRHFLINSKNHANQGEPVAIFQRAIQGGHYEKAASRFSDNRRPNPLRLRASPGSPSCRVTAGQHTRPAGFAYRFTFAAHTH